MAKRSNKQQEPTPQNGKPKTYYFDTNTFTALGQKTEWPILVEACNEGKIKLYLSDIVLTEVCRIRCNNNVRNNPFPTIGLIRERDLFERIYFLLRTWLEEKKVEIIEWDKTHDEIVDKLFNEKDTPLKIDDLSDHRDALIIAAGLNKFTPGEAIFVNEEKKLKNLITGKGYEVIDNGKEFIIGLKVENKAYKLDLPRLDQNSDHAQGPKEELISRLRSIYPELGKIYEEYTANASKVLSETLENIGGADKEIRIDILAYAQALAPVSKETLINLLASKATPETIHNNAQRLVQEQILHDTGSHWLPNIRDAKAQQICEQAVAQRVDNLVKLLGGG